MDRVKFYKCSKEEYERIVAQGLINPYAFYFVVDDPALYIGQEKVLTERQEQEKVLTERQEQEKVLTERQEQEKEYKEI